MNEIHDKRAIRVRRLGLPLFVLASMIVIASLGVAHASTQTILYLGGGGTPKAELSESPPTAGSLPNHDPGRDDSPGLLLKKGGGANETDPSKHQMWIAAEGAMLLDGSASVTFWSAMKDFSDKKGKVKAYLLDCAPTGTDCTIITSATKKSNPWSSSGDWVNRTINFGSVSYAIAEDRALVVQLVVTNKAHDDMWFAYDSVEYPSALNLELAAPPTPPTPTTTTTTAPLPPPPTTTTAPPPLITTTTTPTTTTTVPPSVTTTTTTTTTAPPRASTTTTTMPSPITTTTGASQTSTTTTLAVLPATELPPPQTDDPVPQEDASMTPLPDQDADDGYQIALQGGLVDSLDLAIPPSVASSLLSPLLLIRSIIGAFLTTGRGLLIPGLFLVIGVVLIEWQRRRETQPTVDTAEAGA